MKTITELTDTIRKLTKELAKASGVISVLIERQPNNHAKIKLADFKNVINKALLLVNKVENDETLCLKILPEALKDYTKILNDNLDETNKSNSTVTATLADALLEVVNSVEVLLETKVNYG